MSKETTPLTILSNAERRARIKPHGTVLSVGEFLYDLENQAPDATDMGIQAMTTEPTEFGEQLLRIFGTSPPRAIRTFIADDYMLNVTEGDEIYSLAKLLPYRREAAISKRKVTERFLQDLRDSGVNVIIHNPLSGIDNFFPFRNRDHDKGSWVVREDGLSIFYAHTNNFESRLAKADFVVKFVGKAAISLIEDWKSASSDGQGYEDTIVKVVDGIEIYRDGGTKDQSIILDKAVDLIKMSDSVRNVSMLYPDGKVHKALKDVSYATVITSRPTSPTLNIAEAGNLFWIANQKNKIAFLSDKSRDQHKYRIIEYPLGWAHGKLLTGMLKDGTEWAFFGSHNLSGEGVKAGTKEKQILVLGINSDNIRIINGLNSWFTDLLAQIKYEEHSKSVELKPKSRLHSTSHHARPDPV